MYNQTRNTVQNKVLPHGEDLGGAFLSSGKFIWKRLEHKRTEEGTSYSTEIIATAATEIDATDVVNRLNAQAHLHKTLMAVQEKIAGYAAPHNGMTARNCLASIQKILNSINNEEPFVISNK